METQEGRSNTLLTVPLRNPSEALQQSSEVTPSPMTLVSGFLADQEPDLQCKSFSQLLAGAMASSTAQSGDGMADTSSSSTKVPSNPSPVGGSIAEGPAAREQAHKVPGGPGSAGAGRSNTARFKSMTPSRLPIPRSPYLTIPAGLSPTTLLDSPVLLSTGQAEPSPTTGTFPLPPISHASGSTVVADSSIARSSDRESSSTFVFKPFSSMERNPPSPLAKLVQIKAQVKAPLPSSLPVGSAVPAVRQTEPLASSVHASKLVIPLQSVEPSESTWQPPKDASEKKNQPALLPPPPHLPPNPHPPIERPSEDGYNWRKYGQKQVKGSEFPRSYYKCTHPSCPVKKKVERSHDGQVTEIVYKGEHNHPKPLGTRRMSMGATRLLTNGNAREGFDSAQTINSSGGATQTPEPSSGSTSDDERDGEGSKAEDGDADDPDSKRRKKEKAGAPAPLRTVREPRVVVQTTSDVDILDDGYRWRKYGQKVVKGNPHPRSYYKCTNLGCMVRKHAERSSTDPKAVITTYEGKHNHDVPISKNGNHDTSGSTASAVPLPHAHAGISDSSGHLVARRSSLEDHYLMGTLLEDRLKGENSTVSMDSAGRETTNVSMVSDQQSRGHILLQTFVPNSMSLMNTGSNGHTPQGPESLPFEQGLALSPKEEQKEGHLNSNSLQAAFSGSLSFTSAHKMALGP